MVKQLLILLLCATAAYGMSVELQWDANKESNLAGYKIYVRDRTAATTFVLVSTLHKQTSVVLGNLSSAHKYEFRATAYNTNGEESPYSNPVYVNTPVTKIKVKKLRGSIR